MCTWKNKGCEIHWEGPMSCDQISLRAGRFGLVFFFGARWLSIKYFPGSWGFCSCLWTLFRWADRLTVLLKSFNLFLHQIVVNVDVFVILFTLVFEHCCVCVVSPNTACGCMHITYKTFQEREERKRMSEWLSKQEILYIYECSICK